jgi:adenylosuccinate synthase
MLDIDYGTYPFVTSSSTCAGGASTGSGVGPREIHEIIGISKAYITRVGSGPFPTELEDEFGERLRTAGGEFGSTTGRPRRCGWFDALVARYSVRINGLTGIALTKLDVLSGFDTIKVCTGYRFEGQLLTELPASMEIFSRCQPVYEELPGWCSDITSVKRIEDLPANARTYIKRLEELVTCPISLVSVGPRRDETIILRNPFL